MTGGNHERMPGRVQQSWCPSCHAPAGPDCPDAARDKRFVRRKGKRETHEALRAAARVRQVGA